MTISPSDLTPAVCAEAFASWDASAQAEFFNEVCFASASGSLVPAHFVKAELVACVEREIRMRESLYPKFVSRGKLDAATAVKELQRMRDVLSAIVLHVPEPRSEGDQF